MESRGHMATTAIPATRAGGLPRQRVAGDRVERTVRHLHPHHDRLVGRHLTEAIKLLSSARCPPPMRNGRINVFLAASVTVLLPVSPGYVATGLLVGMVPPDTFVPFLARKWVDSVAVAPPPLKMLTSALPLLPKSRFPGVQTQT